ncbi:MAG: hypothetical protein Q7J98_10015, partial [Kiritimatiellia bacterium]|nr:hypothetical protein [Kiritimatiellia bacterium]
MKKINQAGSAGRVSIPPEKRFPISKGSMIKLPDIGMFIGSAIYLDRGDYIFQHSGKFYTSWVSEDRDPEWYLDRVVKDNQGNLVAIWDGGATKLALKAMASWMDLKSLGYDIPNPDWERKRFLKPIDWDVIEKNKARYGAGLLKLVKEAAAKGLYSYAIYSDAEPEWTKAIGKMKDWFMGNNIGERFSFDIESDDQWSGTDFREKKTDVGKGCDLEMFANLFMAKVRKYIHAKKTAGWHKILVTSASFHVDYEIISGVDLPVVEDFAFGNLNIASSLSRGLQKQFALPFWGSNLAHEHYSWLPYKSKYKFQTLDKALRLKYMSGCKLTLLESGNWWQQSDHVADTKMHETPKLDFGNLADTDPYKSAPYVKEARKHYQHLNYNSRICKKYRESLSSFYDFVKKNRCPDGQPEVTIAAIKGNLDLCSQEFNSNLAVAGAYKIAENNMAWYESAPEKSWNTIKNVFYPFKNIMGKYKNRLFSGTPHGMIDIISFAGEVNAGQLASNYKALIFAGWNTASEKQVRVITEFVKGGGILFLGIPHLSKNKTRNYTNYTVDELVNHGDFSELCGVKIKGRGRQYYWITIPEKNNILNLPQHKHYGICGTHLGDIELCGNPDVIAVEDEECLPVLLRNKCGKGEVYFLNSWEYPGALDRDEGPSAEVGSKGFVGEVLKKIATDTRGSVFITDEGTSPGKECEHVAYSYFPSNNKIYLLNVDFDKSHEIVLHHNGQAEKIRLKPSEFTVRTNCGGKSRSSL